MSHSGQMSYFLGVEVLQNSKGIFICQGKYAKDVLERFGMSNIKAVGNPTVSRSKLYLGLRRVVEKRSMQQKD